jgi:hypothetical protein
LRPTRPTRWGAFDRTSNRAVWVEAMTSSPSPPIGEACEACERKYGLPDFGAKDELWLELGSFKHVKELHALLARKEAETAEHQRHCDFLDKERWALIAERDRLLWLVNARDPKGVLLSWARDNRTYLNQHIESEAALRASEETKP